jgi:hypothetical protein
MPTPILMCALPLLTNEPRVITEVINEKGLKAYLVGFDFGQYCWDDFIEEVADVVVEFAFGHHKDIRTDYRELRRKLKQAAVAIYKIPEFAQAADLYLQGISISDDDVEKDFLRRGEFGELLLHLLLTDFNETIPLISKIFFKDTIDATVHGFDAVHIQPRTNTLWLGESKLFVDGAKGIRALIKDLEDHFTEDYLENEFVLIEKKIPEGDAIPNRQHWVNLLHQKRKLSETIDYIRIPLLCTYTSPNFSAFNDEKCDEFKAAYANEVKELNGLFKRLYEDKIKHKWKGKMDVTVLLFPIKCKNDFIKRMHEKLYYMQRI